jgi:hypothetical protein
MVDKIDPSSILWLKMQMRCHTGIGAKDTVRFQKQNCAKFYKCKRQHAMLKFYAECHQDQHKSMVAKAASRLLVK